MKNRRLNPAAIGIFVIGALVIAVLSIILFGSGRLFGGERASFVCFFEDTVDGMQIGSKVKLKGVPIGEVQRILLRFPHQSGQNRTGTKPLIPVIIEVDMDRLSEDLGMEMDFREEKNYQAQILGGLRATLGYDNFVAGILQVNLDYHDEVEAPDDLTPFTYRGEEYRVIPTLPSQLVQAKNDLLSVVNNISNADFKGVVDGLNVLLHKLTEKLDHLEVKGINAALKSIESRMSSPKFDDALDAVTSAAKAVEEVADNLNEQLGEAALGNAVASADETFRSLTEATKEFRALVESTQAIPAALEDTVKKIGGMAAEIKDLATYLRENPSAIIFGPKEEKGKRSERRPLNDRKPFTGGPRS